MGEQERSASTPEQRERILCESWFARSWKDTKDWIGRWQFWLAEVFIGGAVGVVTQNAVAVLLFIGGLAFLFWLVAVITAPRRQRDEVRTLLREIYHPSIKLDCPIRMHVTFTDGVEEMLFWIRVRNTGIPTSLVDWKLQPQNGEFSVKPRIHPHIDHTGARATYTVDGKEYIQNKTFTPIKTGQVITGILAAHFPGRALKELVKENPEASIRIKCSDVYGKEYEEDVRVRGPGPPRGEFPAIPGVDVVVTPRMPAIPHIGEKQGDN